MLSANLRMSISAFRLSSEREGELPFNMDPDSDALSNVSAPVKGTFPLKKVLLSEKYEKSIFRRMRKGERILSGRWFLRTDLL